MSSDLDYVLGRHSIRSGIILTGGWYHSNATSNYLGQYTFDSPEAYLANQPSNYTRRVGDPNIAYRNLQAGVYVQDDIRVRKNLTLTPGVRYEWQTHVHDLANLGPRFGITWAPFAGGQTTIRSSVGLFYDWLPNGRMPGQCGLQGETPRQGAGLPREVVEDRRPAPRGH